MIASLHGTLVEALPTQVVVDVQGVGYEVFIPLSTYEKLSPVGQPVRLLTELVVREDAHRLYGFLTQAERDTFRLLIHTVSGIGPKIALNILSRLSVTEFRAAVARGDLRTLSSIAGVGRKTAERIIVELKDKMARAAVAEGARAGSVGTGLDATLQDAVLALMALGCKAADAQQRIQEAAALLGPQATVETLVRAALKRSASGT
ncbi:MAG: Holliday junction branch migration protein RuvA [Verrucomicrobiota bacterium]|nr:Holliday junction branch migration protein RuvA [Limisphaera sp.]MDW8381023.1 Holliday junction branch migration protein RuvA [Verrucomicrobiota bacterium]